MYSYWKCLGMNYSALECRVILGNESQLPTKSCGYIMPARLLANAVPKIGTRFLWIPQNCNMASCSFTDSLDMTFERGGDFY